MAELPPLTLKLSTDVTALRVVVDELSAAFKRIDERLAAEEMRKVTEGLSREEFGRQLDDPDSDFWKKRREVYGD